MPARRAFAPTGPAPMRPEDVLARLPGAFEDVWLLSEDVFVSLSFLGCEDVFFGFCFFPNMLFFFVFLVYKNANRNVKVFRM